MDVTEIVAIVMSFGTLVPLLTSVVQQPQWSARTRTFMGVGVATIAGAAAYVTQFGLSFGSPAEIVAVVVGVILASATSYQSIWKPSGITSRIETATSRTVVNPEEVIPEDEGIPDTF